MTNISNYDEFVNEGLWDTIKTGAKKAVSAVGSALHKTMTTGEDRKPEEQNNTVEGEKEVTSDTKTKDIKTETKPVVSKVGRIVKGDNAFIDTKSGEIVAMDVILNEKELNEVITLWKKNDKKGAASILKNFAIRERNMQFNIAVGLMMSALCLGAGACIPKLKAQVSQENISSEVTSVIPTEGIGYKNALLKFYQELGDKFGIGTGKKFINGVATKEEMFNLFDTLAKKKGISTDDFMQQMFSKSHGGNTDMIKAEIDYLAKCKADTAIKTVGDIFNKTDAADMTGVKGFKPFGISSPENAKKLQSFFNDIEGVGKKTVSKIVNTVKDVVKPGNELSAADKGSLRGMATAAGVSPSASGVDPNKKRKNESNVLRFDDFIKK